MSSTPQTELRSEDLRAALGRWLKVEVTGLERIGGGRNSQVYKVTVEVEGGGLEGLKELKKLNGLKELNGLREGGGAGDSVLESERFALKIYFRHPNDQRDRLATEFNSFSYLWANGIRDVPQPLAHDPGPGWALYQFIEGEKVPPGQASDAQLLAAADFLGRLRELSRRPKGRKLGLASEACLAPQLIVENVRARLERLRGELPPKSTIKKTPNYEELREFLDREFAPLLAEVSRWSEAGLRAAGMSFAEELDWALRTLSPSDFGFHNALRQPDGRIIFLDFEYFGWDDPAKMIADFLLHPAMNLSANSKRTFAAAIFRRFSDWPGLANRVAGVYPLFGLKWCTIMLNEFLPDSYLRRQFAAATAVDRSTLQLQQLDKARQLLLRIRQEYQSFPYCD
ncbi:MAG TPA: phosphotransferase [Candidatus Binatia bacterium]|jgi:hypothetical protein|nr:phosphotransferase [Candidatus Binatia bacterium]